MQVLQIHFHAGVAGINSRHVCSNCEGEIAYNDFVQIQVRISNAPVSFYYHLRCVDVFGAVDVLSKIPT